MNFIEHIVVIVIGLILMVVGLALGVTIVLLPLGLPIGLLGLGVVVSGISAVAPPVTRWFAWYPVLTFTPTANNGGSGAAVMQWRWAWFRYVLRRPMFVPTLDKVLWVYEELR